LFLLARPGFGDLLDLPPLDSELNPVGVEVPDHTRTRSSLVKATFAIAATSMPVLTAAPNAPPPGHHRPAARRMIRTSRWPD
jgi:hypothetical protein